MQRTSYPDAIRGVGILLVVAIHATAYLKLPDTGAWGVLRWLTTQAAVPVFFLAEGWLHAMRHRAPETNQGRLERLKASAWRLMLPWAVFSVLYLLMRLGFEHVSHAPVSVLPDGIADLPLALWRGFAASSLYFLPALLIVRILSAWAFPLVRGRPLAAVAAAFLVIAAWRGGLRPFLYFPAHGEEPLMAAAMGIGFAAVGWALAEAELAGWRQRTTALAAAALGLFALLVPGLSNEWGQVPYVLLLWLAARNLEGWRLHAWAAALGRRTMEIYLLHGPTPIRMAAGAALAAGLPAPAALVAVTAAGVVASLVMARILRLARLGWVIDPGRIGKRDPAPRSP